MSTELVVVKKEQLVSYLDTLGLTSKLTEKEKEAYINIAQAYGLNPFKREIHVSKYGDNLSIITGYEVYIKRAERTGQLDGWSATTEGSVKDGNLKAIVTIYRKDRSHPFVWESLYEECVQLTKDGRVTKFWQKAAFMTKKVAISQGFRLCFSDELAGMPYTADEMPDSESYQDVPHVEVEADPVVTKVVDIEACFDKLSAAEDKKGLAEVWKALGKEEKLVPEVLALKDALKVELA